FYLCVAWERGACLCCPSQRTLLNPGRFIQESKLTVWFSVPSVGMFMKRLGMLKPDMYPTLRWSLFCGEPLPAEIASAWAGAAPKSIIENLYGPTELTIACTLYRWNAASSPAECHLGLVPIGWPYPGMDAIVVIELLGAVEAQLRREANVEAAVALGWPMTPSGSAGIVAFVGDTVLSPAELRERVRATLPAYAVPREIRVLPKLPLNANGKVDRTALL